MHLADPSHRNQLAGRKWRDCFINYGIRNRDFSDDVDVARAWMDEERFCVTWTVGIFQPDCFDRVDRVEANFCELTHCSFEHRLSDAIDNHFRAYGKVVTDVADIQVRLVWLWTRTG